MFLSYGVAWSGFCEIIVNLEQMLKLLQDFNGS